MSRRNRAVKRAILPDAVFNSLEVAKLVNVLMKGGKKSLAQFIVHTALTDLGRRLAMDPVEAYAEVCRRLKPIVEVRPRRMGGATYQVPSEVPHERGLALLRRWLVQAARKRGEKGMPARLAAELFDAFHKRGSAFKKREEMEKVAAANQAFAHFRWN